MSKTLSDVLSKTLEKMNLATKDDIEKLNKKLHVITGRVKKLEGGAEEQTE
jgi:hypothetical protein